MQVQLSDISGCLRGPFAKLKVFLLCERFTAILFFTFWELVLEECFGEARLEKLTRAKLVLLELRSARGGHT